MSSGHFARIENNGIHRARTARSIHGGMAIDTLCCLEHQPVWKVAGGIVTCLAALVCLRWRPGAAGMPVDGNGNDVSVVIHQQPAETGITGRHFDKQHWFNDISVHSAKTTAIVHELRYSGSAIQRPQCPGDSQYANLLNTLLRRMPFQPESSAFFRFFRWKIFLVPHSS